MSNPNETSICKNDNQNNKEYCSKSIENLNNKINSSIENNHVTNNLLKKSKQISNSTTFSSSSETATIENDTNTLNRVAIKYKNKIENCDKKQKDIIINKSELKNTTKYNERDYKIDQSNDISEVTVKQIEAGNFKPKINENQKKINIEHDLLKENTKVNDELLISPSKSILSNGTIRRKQSLKKSVSFDPDDETVKKFIEGETIIDKKNPFKNGLISNDSDEFIKDNVTKQKNINNNNNSNNKKSVFKILRDKDKNKILHESEYITTEEVLNQSKYVKTYIKNPDREFKYDPTVLQRLKCEELRAQKDKEKPEAKKVSKLSAHTQLRFKELTNKSNSSREPLPLYTKIIKVQNAKTPTFKKVSKANYPDLSDIKVKTGTDLEESLFSPEEVTKNVKKFDERLKTLHISSDDDLEEFDESLTKSDSSDELKSVIDPTDKLNSIFNPITKINNTALINDNNSKTGTFTNTVNSKEFQEYLDKKGLTLTPTRQFSNDSSEIIETKNHKQQKQIGLKLDICDNKNLQISDKIEMENKKQKKQSVLQRIKSSGFFSSKRKTTPKESVPIPVLYPKENGIKAPLNSKRVILERQSFHAGSSNNLNSSNEFKKHIERSRKSYTAGEDRSSSISSALSNAEDQSVKTLRNELIEKQQSDIKENHIPKTYSKVNNLEDATTNIKLLTKPQRSRSTSRERFQNSNVKSQNEYIEKEGYFIKPKVLRPNLQISSLKRLPVNNLGHNEKQSSTALRRSNERQSLIQKKVTSPNDDSKLNFNRTASMDRQHIVKRNGSRQNSSLPKPIRQSMISQKINGSITTPKNSKEDLLSPKITSTPNNNDEMESKKSLTSIQKPISPIPTNFNNSPDINLSYSVGIGEWEKLKEIKENTDRELFVRAVNSNTANACYENHRNIYERVSLENKIEPFQTVAQQEQNYRPQQAQPQIRKNYQNNKLAQPLYAQLISKDNFVRGSVERNTFNGIPLRRRNNNIEERSATIPENFIVPIKTPVLISNELYPSRSQSVLDEMLTPGYPDKMQYFNPEGKSSTESESLGTPVRLRRKEIGNFTRDEILQKVKEYCRRSMSKIPTKLSVANHQTLAPQNNIQKEMRMLSQNSPVAYISVDSQNVNISSNKITVAPQVPQRIQSLKQANYMSPNEKTPQTSPIYAHVVKRNSIQSNISDVLIGHSPNRQQNIPVSYAQKKSVIGSNEPYRYANSSQILQTKISEISDSMFLPNGSVSVSQDPIYISQNCTDKDSSNRKYIIMESEQIIPSQVIKFRNSPIITANNNLDRNGQIMSPNSLGYIHLQHGSTEHSQIQTRSSKLDGRSTSLVLGHAVNGPNQSSQNYWTPQQHSPIPLHHSPVPRYSPLIQQSSSCEKSGSFVFLRVKDQMYRPINPSFGKLNENSNQIQSFRSQYSQQTQEQLQHHHQNFLSQQSPMVESESGSETGEVQRIMQPKNNEEDWQNEKGGRNQAIDQGIEDRRRATRREDPRRHTLGSDMLQYTGSAGIPGGGGIVMQQSGQQQQRTMDLEMGTRAQKTKKNQAVRGYTPINQGPLFDEDPGIMSEVETASTGFRRGNKQRSSLPVVRTPSKTLERPLGLVFLQYRSETKRALLPNEITSIDTVRALFVRSFPRQLTMAYLEGPNVKIYIHDASKDMFYELEDVRSHLREIRDRSVLRLFESNEVAAPQVLPGGPGIPQPLPQPTQGHWDQDQSYFSEPEFDSEYQHQHIHRSKGGKTAPYYVGAAQTLPRGMYSDRNKNAVGAPVKPLRSYGSRGSMGPPYPYTPDQLYSIPDGYTSSPERGTRGAYEEPYYSQYGTRSAPIAPIITEEQRCDSSMTEDEYALYGMKVSGRIPRNANQLYDPSRPEDLHRIRVEHMERQLANLTGLVQKALVNQNPQIIAHSAGVINPNFLGVPGQCRGLDDMDGHSSGSSTSIQANGIGDELFIREKPPKLGKSMSHKSVSFEKSVSFSDDIQGVPKSHSPQHAGDSKPPKPAIKSSTLPRTSSQERDRLKPPPPPKPLVLAQTHTNYRADIALAPEVYNHLRGLQKKAKDLRMEVRTLRRLSQAQAVAVREDIKDAFMRIRATLLAGSGNFWGQGDQEKTRISREEELYKQEVIRLENDLSDLESSVEGLRGEVINRRTRVNMAAVEDMALVLSRASKTVAELKMKFPALQNNLRNILSNEMEKVVREEKFLKDEPDRLESALRRCKKLTGTLVTLKRLASVQEQRIPVNEPIVEDPPRSSEISSANKPIPSPRLGTITISGGIPPENALDALLDELQTFAKPQNILNDGQRPEDSTSDDSSQTLHNTITTQLSQSSLYTAETGNPNTLQPNPNGPMISLRRLHSYPSGSDTDTSPPQPLRPVGKPPVPERNAELLSKVGSKRIPPPPPPRTSSRSPLASPTSPGIPQRLQSVNETEQMANSNNNLSVTQEGGDSSGNESGNDHTQRQLALEMRHQELLKKQKLLQEQYARLQQMSKNTVSLQSNDIMQLKKTGSESNLPQKMGLNMSVTGSMKNLNSEANNVKEKSEKNLTKFNNLAGESNKTFNRAGAGSAVNDENQVMTSNNIVVAQQSTQQLQTTTNKVYETDIL